MARAQPASQSRPGRPGTPGPASVLIRAGRVQGAARARDAPAQPPSRRRPTRSPLLSPASPPQPTCWSAPQHELLTPQGPRRPTRPASPRPSACPVRQSAHHHPVTPHPLSPPPYPPRPRIPHTPPAPRLRPPPPRKPPCSPAQSITPPLRPLAVLPPPPRRPSRLSQALEQPVPSPPRRPRSIPRPRLTRCNRIRAQPDGPSRLQLTPHSTESGPSRLKCNGQANVFFLSQLLSPGPAGFSPDPADSRARPTRLNHWLQGQAHPASRTSWLHFLA